MTDVPYVTYRKTSFLAAMAWGFSAVLITVILGATTLGLYGLNVVDRRSDDLVSLARVLVEQIPELKEVLPASMIDPFEDRRDPSYMDNVKIDVALSYDSDRQAQRPSVRVRNEGDEVISLLGLRVVVVDRNGLPLDERIEYIATPITAGDDWRGPLMPRAIREIPLRTFRHPEAVDVRCEITDLRIWTPQERIGTSR